MERVRGGTANPSYLFTASPRPLRLALAGTVLFAISDWVVLARLTHEILLLWFIVACSVGLAGFSGALSSYYWWKGRLDLRDQAAAWMIACAVGTVDALTILGILAISRADAVEHVIRHH